MNYVLHTRAAHERLRAQPHVTPVHVSLYWALFFTWNAQRFPSRLELDHEHLMRDAHIGNLKTYRNALYALEAWGLLTYHPSQSRYRPSYCRLNSLDGTEAPSVATRTKGTYAPPEKAALGADVPTVNVPSEGTYAPATPPTPEAEVPQDTLLGKTWNTVNGGGINAACGQHKKKEADFTNEGLSEAHVFDEQHSCNQVSADVKEKVAQKRNRKVCPPAYDTDTTPPEPRRRSRPTRNPEIPFTASDIATVEAFIAAFTDTDYALADLRYYHALVANWRKNGDLPLRRDWKATATRFILNDAHDNRLKLAPTTQYSSPGTNQSYSGSSPSGYRSSRWD